MQAQSILRWRSLAGPLVILAAGGAFLLIDRYVYPLPVPAIWLLFFALFTAYAGISEMRARREQEKIVEADHELEILRAALDQVDSAVMLLDRDFRVQFMNRTAINNGGFRQRASAEKPSSAELLREFATNGAYPMPANKVERFVAGSLEIVRAANSAPIDLRLADEKVFRFKCNTLPGGGRMLIYSDVSDFIRNADKLHLLAITDAMTGLYNHRHFMKLAKGEWDRFLRHHRSLSVLMVDIDFFKTFNDRFGHEVGDLVLYHVASMLRNDRRSNDIVARIGGEEFAILMPETDIKGTATVAERLRQKIDENPFHGDGKDLRVTVSIGIAEAKQGMQDFSDLLKRADQALYEAKRSGRNRVVRADRLLVAVPETVAPLQSGADAQPEARGDFHARERSG